MKCEVQEKVDKSISEMMKKGFSKEDATRILLISVSKEYVKLYDEVNNNDRNQTNS